MSALYKYLTTGIYSTTKKKENVYYRIHAISKEDHCIRQP